LDDLRSFYGYNPHWLMFCSSSRAGFHLDAATLTGWSDIRSLKAGPFIVSKISGMTDQPECATAYQDEWGAVTHEVYQAAESLREQAESYARATLGAEADGRTLLAKAAATVTRALEDRHEQIANLEAYLFQTYKRMVLAEVEKERARSRILAELAGSVSQNGHDALAELDQYILIKQLRRRMNQRTRMVFDLLALGHTFEEIGLILGKSSRAVRNN
jgi:DNA-directed RNA polymerase specialized sigma24 family protein